MLRKARQNSGRQAAPVRARWRRALAGGAAAALVLGGSAVAQAAPPSLVGTSLSASAPGDTVRITADCADPWGPLIRFAAQGQTVGGAYPGTFTTSGTIRLGALYPVSILPDTFSFGLTALFDATFTIDSGATTVTGAEHGVLQPVPGVCTDVSRPRLVLGLPGATGQVAGGLLWTSYTARIETPAGAFSDSGYSMRSTSLIQLTSPGGGRDVQSVGDYVAWSNGVWPTW